MKGVVNGPAARQNAIDINGRGCAVKFTNHMRPSLGGDNKIRRVGGSVSTLATNAEGQAVGQCIEEVPGPAILAWIWAEGGKHA